MRLVLFALLLLATQGHAANQGFDQSRAYAGAGLTFNSVGTAGNATGLQVFAGYEFDGLINNDIHFAAEAGFMDSGDFDTFGFGRDDSAEGVWVAFPFRVAIDKRLDALMRVGADFGDDDGLLVGAGMGYNFNERSTFRVEYVVRDHINSFQFNMLFKL